MKRFRSRVPYQRFRGEIAWKRLGFNSIPVLGSHRLDWNYQP